MNPKSHSLKKQLLAITLCFTIFAGGCSSAQFIAVLNEVGPAVLTILQIVAVFKGVPADTSLATKVSADTAALEKLYTDYEAALAAGNTTTTNAIENDINAGFSTLNQDLSTVLSAAQVSNPQTQAKVTALIGLIQTAVSIAEATIPSLAMKNHLAIKAVSNLNVGTFVSQYNAVLISKTGVASVDTFTPHHKLHGPHFWGKF